MQGLCKRWSNKMLCPESNFVLWETQVVFMNFIINMIMYHIVICNDPPFTSLLINLEYKKMAATKIFLRDWDGWRKKYSFLQIPCDFYISTQNLFPPFLELTWLKFVKNKEYIDCIGSPWVICSLSVLLI